jgi:hypothetical protein
MGTLMSAGSGCRPPWIVLSIALAVGVSVRAALLVDEPALLKEIGFSAQEIERIGRGEIVARTVDADGSAVALAVAGTIGITAEFYLQKFRDIESFKKTKEVQQIGRFGRPPAAADMSRMTLEQEDIDDLRSCRVGACGVKLDREGIQALAGRDARIDTASAKLRDHLAAYTQRYLQSGNRVLMEYHDNAPPGRVSEQLGAISTRTPYLRRWPSLYDAVFDFNGTLPAGIDDFVYWSKEKVGPRAVVSITHVLISPPREGATVVATKQIYASHYGNASLGLTVLLDKGTPDAPRMRIIYLNRSRVDVFGGILGPLKRPLVRSRAREGAERMMQGLEARLEKQYADRPDRER